MIIDTGQIKAEMRREGKGIKKNADSRALQNSSGNVKALFSNIKAGRFSWDAFITNIAGHCTKNLISE